MTCRLGSASMAVADGGLWNRGSAPRSRRGISCEISSSSLELEPATEQVISSQNVGYDLHATRFHYHEGVPQITLACNNCGHMLFFSPAVIGIQPDVPERVEIPSEKPVEDGVAGSTNAGKGQEVRTAGAPD